MRFGRKIVDYQVHISNISRKRVDVMPPLAAAFPSFSLQIRQSRRRAFMQNIFCFFNGEFSNQVSFLTNLSFSNL